MTETPEQRDQRRWIAIKYAKHTDGVIFDQLYNMPLPVVNALLRAIAVSDEAAGMVLIKLPLAADYSDEITDEQMAVIKQAAGYEMSNEVVAKSLDAAYDSGKRDAYSDGFKAGQEQMREKALLVLPGGQICDPQEIADTIRALPIEDKP